MAARNGVDMKQKNKISAITDERVKNNQVIKKKKKLLRKLGRLMLPHASQIIGVNAFNFNHHLWDAEIIATWCN